MLQILDYLPFYSSLMKTYAESVMNGSGQKWIWPKMWSSFRHGWVLFRQSCSPLRLVSSVDGGRDCWHGERIWNPGNDIVLQVKCIFSFDNCQACSTEHSKKKNMPMLKAFLFSDSSYHFCVSCQGWVPKCQFGSWCLLRFNRSP